MSFYERYNLVRTALSGAEIDLNEFLIVPLPIYTPQLYKYYVPLDAVFFLVIYDVWGRRKKSYFESLGLKVHVLREVPPQDNGISAGEIRRRMMENRPWKEWVPTGVAEKLERWKVSERLKQMQKKLL